jgi:hypothetical protein
VTTRNGGLSTLPNPFLLEPLPTGQPQAGAVTGALSVRERRIADLVAENAASVRLSNSISAAAGAGSLPYDTVGEYLDAAEQASAVMCRSIRNFGQKTARELAALVNEECARHPRPWVKPDADAEAEVRAARRSDLLALFSGQTIGEFLAGEHVSVRLGNVLTRPELRDRPLTDVFDGSVFTIASMMRITNLGRKSIDEFRILCARLVARRFRTEGYDPLSCEAGAQLLLGGMGAVSLVVDAFKIAELNDDVPTHLALADRVDWLLSELDARSADVLQSRFGIDRPTSETLEEIGNRLKVTRERIRQIEAKALRKLQKRTLRASVRKLIADQAPGAWSALRSDDSLLIRDELHARKRRLDPRLVFALEISGMELDQWLDEIAAPFPLGWHVSEAHRKSIDEAARSLTKSMESLPIPRAFDGFDPSLDSDSIAAASQLVLGLRVKSGYVMPARVGARLSRVIGLHAILARRPGGAVLTDLITEYHGRFPNDMCSGRDAEIVMQAASHLFIETEERHWAALGPGGVLPPRREAAECIRPFAEDPGTIAGALQDALRARGPTRLTDLTDDAEEILPEGRSSNSIGPVLLTRSDLFVRLLPGVYGLPEHLEMQSSIPEEASYLLNETQARLYCLARFADEPQGTFPFWSANTEYRMCKWARHSGSQSVFSSLLAIADIGTWPLPEDRKDEWILLKARQGRFEASGPLRRDAAYERPDLERVLAACIYASKTGSLSWMSVNRICGRKLDSHGGVGTIALLLRLGALVGPEPGGFDWLRRCPCSSDMARLVSFLSEELSRTGILDWNSAVGQELAKRASESAPSSDSWIDAEAFDDMVGGRTPEGLAETLDPIEELLAQHRQVRDLARREERLQWLLADA